MPSDLVDKVMLFIMYTRKLCIQNNYSLTAIEKMDEIPMDGYAG